MEKSEPMKRDSTVLTPEELEAEAAPAVIGRRADEWCRQAGRLSEASGAPPVGTHMPVWVVLGIPGSGKSVLLKKLVNRAVLRRAHIGDFIASLSGTGDLVRESKAKGALLPGFDEQFLTYVSALFRENSVPIAIDGYPRSLEQLERLVAHAGKEGWHLRVIVLSFPPGRQVQMSVSRQYARLNARFTAGSPEYFAERDRILLKIHRAITHDLVVIEVLRRMGINVIELSALGGTSRLARELSDRVQQEIDKERGL